MNTYDEKKDSELSWWARIFYMALLGQVNDMLRITSFKEKQSVENMYKTILSMLASVMSIDIIKMPENKITKLIDYPGDEKLFYKDGPNKELAEDVIFKIILFKRLCERLNKTITFSEFTIFYQLITNHVINDDEESCKSKWYQIIKEFDIDFKYIPIEIKSIIAQTVEELTALKIINQTLEGMQKINGVKFTIESYLEHAGEIMKQLDKKLRDENLFSMVNMEQAPIYAVAVQLGIVPPVVLYNVGDRNSQVVPFSVLEGMIKIIWENMVDGNEEFSKKILFKNSSLYSGSIEDEDDDEDEDEEENKNNKDKPNDNS